MTASVLLLRWTMSTRQRQVKISRRVIACSVRGTDRLDKMIENRRRSKPSRRPRQDSTLARVILESLARKDRRVGCHGIPPERAKQMSSLTTGHPAAPHLFESGCLHLEPSTCVLLVGQFPRRCRLRSKNLVVRTQATHVARWRPVPRRGHLFIVRTACAA